MAVIGGPNLIKNGLVSMWDVASPESSPGSGTVWSDLIGNNDGALTNGPITAEGINKGVISFDGTDDYVSHPTIDTLQSEGWTIMVWLKRTDASQTSWRTIWRYGTAGNGVFIKYGTQELYLERTSVSAPAATTFSDLEFTNLDQWYHLAVSADSTTVRAYLDGVASSTTSSDTADRTWSELQSSTYPWSGSIANAVMYNRSLTAAEIKQNYYATKGRFSTTPSIVKENLVLHLDAGDSNSYPGTGTTWTDLSGEGNNGTLTNGPTFSSSDGGEIVFDGSNDWVDFGDILDIGTDDYTVEIWAKTTENNSYWGAPIFGKNNNSGPDRWKWYSHNGDAYFLLDANSTDYGQSGSDMTDGEWRHLVATLDRDENVTIYVNGSYENSTSISSESSHDISNSTHIRMGRDLNHYLDGSVAIARIYKGKALTSGEVLQNYEAQKGRFV